MMCAGCGKEFPGNFLKSVDTEQGHGIIVTNYYCKDCRQRFIHKRGTWITPLPSHSVMTSPPQSGD